MEMTAAKSKIGVFDSGLGGLTVLQHLVQVFPDVDFLYLGDTARLPYGTKSPETIRQYGEQVLQYLKSQNVAAAVIACNSASSQFPESEWQGLPLFTVIEPGSQSAVKASSSGRIGVIGTRATITSGLYEKTLKRLRPDCQVFSVAAPLLVPLAEENWVDDPVTNIIAFRYLQSLLSASIDTLILGCTHYPLLRTALQKVVGSSVTLIESGPAVAAGMTEFCQQLAKSSQRTVEIGLTDPNPVVAALASTLMPTAALQFFDCDLNFK